MSSSRRPNESEVPGPRRSSPSVELDPNPPKYSTPLPSLPRAPRVPSDVEQLLGNDIRDTDRITGEPELHYQDEKTPVKKQTNWDLLFEQLGKTETAARAAANESIHTRSEVATFRQEIAAFRSRLSALEAERVWIPIVFSSIAIALSLFAILRHQ